MTIENGVLKPSGVIQLRGGTATALAQVNPKPERRELMVEVDTGKIKVGDGIHTWNELPYSGGGATEQPQLTGVNIELTATNITQKSVSLPANCDMNSLIKVYIQGLLTEQDLDWELDSTNGTISWQGHNLEDILRVNDRLFIEYFVI